MKEPRQNSHLVTAFACLHSSQPNSPRMMNTQLTCTTGTYSYAYSTLSDILCAPSGGAVSLPLGLSGSPCGLARPFFSSCLAGEAAGILTPPPLVVTGISTSRLLVCCSSPDVDTVDRARRDGTGSECSRMDEGGSCGLSGIRGDSSRSKSPGVGVPGFVVEDKVVVVSLLSGCEGGDVDSRSVDI